MTSSPTRNELAHTLGAPLLSREQVLSQVGDELADTVSGEMFPPDPTAIFSGPGEGLVAALKKASENAARTLGMDVHAFDPKEASNTGEGALLLVHVSAPDLENSGEFEVYMEKVCAAAKKAEGVFFIVEDIHKAGAQAQLGWFEALTQIGLIDARPINFVSPLIAPVEGFESHGIFIQSCRRMVMQAPDFRSELEARRTIEPVASASSLRMG